MLPNLLERLVWPSLLGLALAAGARLLHTFVHNAILTYGLFSLLILWWGRTLVAAFTNEYKLDRLGKRAPSIRTSTPWNYILIIRGIIWMTQHKMHEWWNFFFSHGNKNLPHTVETLVGGDRIIFTRDEENIKAILATQFSDYGKGPQFRREWKDFLGLSIFTVDGDLWHSSRTLLRPQFIKDRVSDLHKFESHTQILVPMLAGSHPGATVRVDDLFYRFTLDAATDFLFGAPVGSLQHGQTEFAAAFGELQRLQSIISRAGPLQHLMPKKAFNAHLKVLNTFVETYIDRALQLPQEELDKVTKSDEGYTFLHALASYTRDRQVLRDQLVAVLLAGRDTTAVTLSWLFHELSRHPEVVRKLREEIISFVGLHSQPTYNNMKDMRYLQHTLNEIMRLYPVLPYNVRVALKDTTLPHGGGADGTEPIGVLKDTPIAYSTFMLQRREDIYPASDSKFPHYLDFVPERWDSWTPKAWTYIPFNGGPRICIGQQFALTEMAYTVVRILQVYERVESRMETPVLFKTDIVLTPAPAVNVAFFRGA